MLKYFVLFFILIGCTALQNDRSLSVELKALKKDYYNYLEKTCVSDKYYEGFNNTFQYKACLLDDKVLRYQLDINRLAYMWSDEVYYKKRQEIDKISSRETTVFVSFYSPDSKIVDLEKVSTNWRVYLNDGGKRYEASSIIKMPREYEKIKNLYPVHNIWSTAYEIKFEQAVQLLDRDNLTITFTSREGSSKKPIPTYN